MKGKKKKGNQDEPTDTREMKCRRVPQVEMALRCSWLNPGMSVCCVRVCFVEKERKKEGEQRKTNLATWSQR